MVNNGRIAREYFKNIGRLSDNVRKYVNSTIMPPIYTITTISPNQVAPIIIKSRAKPSPMVKSLGKMRKK